MLKYFVKFTLGAFVPVPSRSHSSARLPNIPNPPPRTASVPLNGSAVDTSQVVNNSHSASQQFPIRTFSQHPPNPQLPPTNQVEGNFPSASTSENSRLEVNNVSGKTIIYLRKYISNSGVEILCLI